MAEVSYSIVMATFTKENLKTVKDTDSESERTLMEVSFRETTMTTNRMATGFTSGWTENNTMETGKMASSLEKAPRSCRTVLYTKACGTTVCPKVKENASSMITPSMKETGRAVSSTAREPNSLLTAQNTQELGIKASLMVMESRD